MPSGRRGHRTVMLLAKVKETIKRHSLLSPGDRVVVAVSGGPDSVCLLAVLQELSPKLDLKLQVAHLDHMFRGEGSAADARFVEKLARELGIPATIERIDVPRFCAERGLSAQAGAREARYAFLEQVARSCGANKIATGHTADDQAETLLMRLLRGAGLAGLSGIPPKRGTIVRPLIEATRNEVLAYLHERELGFATDPSNDQPLYTRNRIRYEVLPVLARFNPSVSGTLAAEAALLRDEDEALDAFVAPLLAGLLTSDDCGVRIDRARFTGLLPGVRRRVLRAAVEQLGVPGEGLSAVRTTEALGFMESAQTGRTMELSPGLELAREYDAFLLRPASPPREFSVPLPVPGAAGLPGLSLTAEAVVRDTPVLAGGTADLGENDASRDQAGGNYLWQAQFDYDKITAPLVLRSRRPGDRICPAGMGGRSKKLQDLFTDEKVPRLERDRVPVLAAGDDILWAVGIRTDERFLPGPGTRKVLVVKVRKHP